MTNFNSLATGYQEVISPYTRFKTLIPMDTYRSMRKFIIATISAHGEMTIAQLLEIAQRECAGFGKKTTWYILKVKLDMEARKEIRVKKSSGLPLLRLASSCKV